MEGSIHFNTIHTGRSAEMISGRFCWSGLLAGITFMVLGAAEIETGKAEQKPLLPAKQLQSEPVSAKVRALELYMTALRTRNAAERAAILLEILSLDPTAEAPLDQLYDTVNTAAEAHSAAKKLLPLAKAHPEIPQLAVFVGRMGGFGGMPTDEYRQAVFAAFDQLPKFSGDGAEQLKEFWPLVTLRSAILHQEGRFREGSDWFTEQLDGLDDPAARRWMLELAARFEYAAFLRAETSRPWFGLADSDSEKAEERFRELFREVQATDPEIEDAGEIARRFGFYAGVNAPEAGLAFAEDVNRRLPGQGALVAVFNQALNAGNFPRAEEVIAELRKRKSGAMLVSWLSIRLDTAAGRWQKAAAEIAKIKNINVREDLTEKLLTAKQDYPALKTALATTEKRFEKEPGAALVVNLSQLLLAERSRDVELLNHVWSEFEKAEMLKDPGNANSIGYIAAELNTRLPEAEKLLLFAVEAEPANPAYLDSLGWLRFRQGRLPEAQKLLEQALAIGDPDIGAGVLWGHLGEIKLARNDRTGAIRAFRNALRFSGDEDLNRNRIETLLRQAEEGGR